MGRELKRVALDFNWPLNIVWKGYMCPYQSQKCTVCDGSGQNPETKKIDDDWYDFAGTGRKWCYNITQDEVDALIEGNRLRDFTHTWNEDDGWVAIDPQPLITAKMINEWAADRGICHDAINCWICVEARAKRLGVFGSCEVCRGEGVIWFNEEIKKLTDEWEGYEPPEGEGWQLWENVSEGSPISPVFDTKEKFIEWLVGEGYSRIAAENFSKSGYAPSMAVIPGQGLVRDIEIWGVENA